VRLSIAGDSHLSSDGDRGDGSPDEPVERDEPDAATARPASM
jgi:hypothetical protein